jgi:5'-nucleotidase
VIDDALVDASGSYSPPPARPAPRRTASSGGTRYKVKKGESLWSIAQARYGNGNKWKAIAAANPSIDPDRIQAGQTIVLP